jgi:class 3 adenylate cyclase
MAFLFVDLTDAELLYKELGDVRAYEQYAALLEIAGEAARREEGTLMTTSLGADTIGAAFPSALRAVRAGVEIARAVHAKGASFSVRAGVHEGRCIALTRARDVEYFGQTLHRGTALLRDSPRGGLALSTAVAAERAVMAYLQDQKLVCQVMQSSDAAYGGRRVTLVSLDETGLPRSLRRTSTSQLSAVRR